MAKIKMKVSVIVADTFHDFLMAKKSMGLSEKTIITYGQHFSAIAKHLQVDKSIDELNKADIESMIASMRDAGLSANSIRSYTRTLKSFFSWCNETGITRLNLPLYKAEETVKEKYERLQREQAEKEAAYEQACITYEDEVKHFEDALEQYNVLADRYAKKLQEFELQKQQKEQLASREKEVKAGVYAKALEEKKAGLLKEKKEIQRYLADYAVQQESVLSEKADQLPAVQRSTAAALFIDGEIKSLAADLFAVYGAIDELNSFNIVYKKYRDFYVLCILYEYFLSGRVTELGGADGAYNLYESELKTDKILNKLDLIDERLETIISKLDDIKESQVVLYEAMKEADQGIQKLNDSMEKLIGEFSAVQYSSGVLPTADLPSYGNYSTVIGSQHDRIGTTVQRASVIKRGILGGIIAGPAGAVVGALSAIDKNRQ